MTASRRQLNALAALLSAAAVLLSACGIAEATAKEDQRHKAECQMWMKLENKTLPLQNQGHAHCVTNDNCTGFTCKGTYQNTDLMFGLRVKPCDIEPGVEIYGHAPQFHTDQFSHTFYHKERYTIPGALMNASLLAAAGDDPALLAAAGNVAPMLAALPNINMRVILEVHLKKVPGRDTLELGLRAKGCINATCILDKAVFNNTEIPVPACPAGQKQQESPPRVNTMCNVNDLFSCTETQTCVQFEANQPEGKCECRTGFMKQQDGSCGSPSDSSSNSKRQVIKQLSGVDLSQNQEELQKTSSQPSPQVESGDASSGSSASDVAAAVVSVLVVVVIAVAAFIVLRTRLTPRLRARLTNTPYEDIVIADRQPDQHRTQHNGLA